ncbi:MAG: cupin domain-containing protein [Rhodospirillales bacterium]|nr:MAG: cupin domain-containing protein [Rhodospirillales bacterium]
MGKAAGGKAAPKAKAAALARQVVVSHAAADSFAPDGLRPFFEYRDLGLMGVTGGRVHAHVIRARPGMHADAPRHWHDLDFQFVYVLKGWVKFHYEGYGDVTLEAGSMVYQPPRIKHKEIAHSDDLELIEITSPGEFATHAVE